MPEASGIVEDLLGMSMKERIHQCKCRTTYVKQLLQSVKHNVVVGAHVEVSSVTL